MDERLKKIREILEDVEKDMGTGDDKAFVRNFDAFELPSIVSNGVRYLQPMLKPYEAAIYWHMFDKSILSTGQQYCRVSTRGLMTGVVLSSSGQSESLSIASTREGLQGLEEKGAILKVGEPNREGTPYKVLLPEEIPDCQKAMKKSVELAEIKSVDVRRELDFYNVPENRLRVFERDAFRCHYCGKQLTRFTATLDHLQPVSKGGDNSFDNLATACLHCNSRRGSRPVMDMLANEYQAKNNV
jgi:hypothetical protein